MDGSSLLAELEVLVVDCQTTGASPAQGSVLELGWCVARADDAERELAAEAHWIAPQAGERISPLVRQLTGFHEAVLETALTPETAWQRLRALMRAVEPTPTAIHFARFELSFLRDWAERFEATKPFPLDAVCVHAIACRLYPDLPRRNLRALAGFLGHGLHLERRSLGHVQATAFI
jgi:DNA polymerase III epsilon subunit-like protein